jgi:hypothetical protein
MTTTHRIATSIAVIASLAGAVAPGAFAGSNHAGAASGTNHAPAAYYSRQDKQMVRLETNPPTGAYYSRQDKTMIAPGTPVTAGTTASVSTSQPVVRIETPNSGFDWGDAGIGALAGIALCMIGIGGAFAVSQRRVGRTYTPQG